MVPILYVLLMEHRLYPDMVRETEDHRDQGTFFNLFL